MPSALFEKMDKLKRIDSSFLFCITPKPRVERYTNMRLKYEPSSEPQFEKMDKLKRIDSGAPITKYEPRRTRLNNSPGAALFSGSAMGLVFRV